MANARVLFVDDEPLIREFYSMLGVILGPGYDIFVVGSAAEGLAFLQQTPVDIVVSDLVMPQMNGHEFMTQVAREHPESMRIVLSAYEDQLTVAQCLMFGHRYMSKPFDLKQLATVLNRICHLKHRLGGENIKKIVSGLGALPTPPRTYQRLTSALNSEFSSMQDVGDIIQDDPGLTVKILQIANSAYFGGGRRIVTPFDAVQLIGVEILRALTLCVHAFKFYENVPFKNFSVSRLWDHSMDTAHGAQRLAKLEKLPRNRCDEAFVSGLLHDIGKLVMAGNASEDYEIVIARSAQGSVASEEVEKEVFGVSHAQIGAYLLGLWGLPDAIVNNVDMHHEPRAAADSTFTPLIAVHVAQCLHPSANRKKQLDVDYLSTIGLQGHIVDWESTLRN